MDSKIAFGYDFLFMMRTLELSSGKNMDPVADAALQFFLITWGFTVDEIDEANTAFLNDVEHDKLPDFGKVMERLVQHVKKDQTAVERILTNSIAVAYIDGEFTEKEVEFIKILSDQLDLRRSELEQHLKTGMQVAFGLNFFGNAYKNKK